MCHHLPYITALAVIILLSGLTGSYDDAKILEREICKQMPRPEGCPK